MSQALTLITGNLHKANQIARYLKHPLKHEKIDLHEIQSLDIEEIITYKAKEAYRKLQAPVLVDDVSLTFKVWGNLPGPFIRWFLAEMGDEGVCKLLDAYDDRSAVATVMFGLADEHGVKTFSASVQGKIADQPRGENGFGWGPILIPEGYDRTWAEMTTEEQDRLPFRKVALAELDKYLTEHPI